MKINLIIGGTEKGGTTSLYSLLKNHLEIIAPRAKELHFFSDDSFFDKEVIDHKQYHKLFLGRSWKHKLKIYLKYFSGARILVDSSPEYMWHNSAPQRVYQYNSDAKWIVLLRNPIDRVFSHYKTNVFKKSTVNEPLSFIEALTRESKKNDTLLQDRSFSYIDKGFYSKQLKNMYKYFDKKNVYVETSDTFKDNTLCVLNDICNFLEIGEYKKQYIPTSYDSNLGVSDIVMSSQEKEFLINIFKDEIKDLECVLKRDLSAWTK